MPVQRQTARRERTSSFQLPVPARARSPPAYKKESDMSSDSSSDHEKDDAPFTPSSKPPAKPTIERRRIIRSNKKETSEETSPYFPKCEEKKLDTTMMK